MPSLRSKIDLSAFDWLADGYAQDRTIIATILISSAIGIVTLWLGSPMSLIACAALVPWAPIILIKLRGDWAKYGWLTIFELLVLFQLAHFAEHVSQMVELHFLDWAPFLARGIIGEFDIEPVHFWWNTLVLCGALALLIHYRQNGWLLGSVLFSIWHQAEHTYIYFGWYVPKGISGHPGILGAGGLVDQANISLPFLTTLGRADLHFWYNLFEIGLFVVAFAVQVLHRPRASTSAPRPDWRRRTLLTAALAQIPLILLLVLFLRSPQTLRVPGDYPTIQAAIDAAPDWAILRVQAGTFREPIVIGKPLTLIGASGQQTQLAISEDSIPAVTISHTHDVALKGFTIRGGLYGILVDESTSVQLLNNRVQSAAFVGIRLSRASAEITGNEVSGVRSPYGMGIELANTISKPPSMIRRNVIADNPHEGLVMHNAQAMIEDNTVTGNGLRGIAVTEMSMATVRGNTLQDNADAGIFVVDSSMAEILGNHITSVRPGPTGAADGIRAYYYAEVMLGNNSIENTPGHDVTSGYEAAIVKSP